jgi:hypothetical protein
MNPLVLITGGSSSSISSEALLPFFPAGAGFFEVVAELKEFCGRVGEPGGFFVKAGGGFTGELGGLSD